MLPYSATDALNSMTASFGIAVDQMPVPRRSRPTRIIRWLRSLTHLA
jgi:hypothetical protein